MTEEPRVPGPESDDGTDMAGEPGAGTVISGAGSDAGEPPATGRRRHRHHPLTWAYNLLRHLPHLPLTTRRGVVLFAFLVTGTAVAAGAGVMHAVEYSESIGFCGLCHTMDPEQKGLAASAHANVTCAECHVEPGVAGFVKAKINGTRQLAEVVTGTFPKPIPPADHAALPSTKDTCLSCHTLRSITAGGGPTQLILRPSYADDEKNTRTTVAVLLRPAAVGSSDAVSVHWHVEKDVTYTSPDEHRQTIDLVEFTDDKGQKETYIAGSKITDSLNTRADVATLRKAEDTHTMDCLDCHNRVGHPLASPSKAVDEALASGALDASVPWIKRDTLALLTKHYPSEADATAAISEFAGSYEQRYPLEGDSGGAPDLGTTLRTIYDQSATPEMKVVAATYPDNLGHQSAPGCFRCHDGAHYRVVEGKVTTEKIPSTCQTCHTFPQSGLDASNVPVGAAPESHTDDLWVFNHKTATTSTSPSGTSCGTCHAPTYCLNCHETGAIKVDHDTMLYNHAESARLAGGTNTCSYCHQPAYCAQCHKSLVMKENPLSVLARSGG